MSDEKVKTCGAMTLLSGVATFAFLAWLCWLATWLAAGVSGDGRTALASEAVWAATGVSMSAIVAAKTFDGNPLEYIAGLLGSLKGMVWRR